MNSIRFEIVGLDADWGCGKCQSAFLKGRVYVEVCVDGKPHVLAADKPAVCPKCGDVKENRTPAVFGTFSAAREKIKSLEMGIAAGMGNLYIPLIYRKPLGPF